jgi:hypothetical protein
MISVLTCQGYRVEARADTIEEAIRLCGELERQTKDTFARVVMVDGAIIADAEGLYRGDEGPSDAATSTGMYDP